MTGVEVVLARKLTEAVLAWAGKHTVLKAKEWLLGPELERAWRRIVTCALVSDEVMALVPPQDRKRFARILRANRKTHTTLSETTKEELPDLIYSIIASFIQANEPCEGFLRLHGATVKELVDLLYQQVRHAITLEARSNGALIGIEHEIARVEQREQIIDSVEATGDKTANRVIRELRKGTNDHLNQLIKEAREGLLTAQVALGCHYRDDPEDYDLDLAERWLAPAAKIASRTGEYKVILEYIKLLNIKNDFRVEYWKEEAALAGCLNTAKNLARNHRDDYPDWDGWHYQRWLEVAANLGDVASMRELARIYTNSPRRRNLDLARYWLERIRDHE